MSTDLLPGEAHGGGHHHQERPLLPVEGSNADGLDGLPQAHVIGKQQAASFGDGKAGSRQGKDSNTTYSPGARVYLPPRTVTRMHGSV